jgi:hypothetical protein
MNFWAKALLALAFVDEERLDQWQLERTLALEGDLHHVQGIDVDRNWLWVSSVDRRTKKGFLYRIALRTGKVAASMEVQDGAKIHPGGLALDGDSLWIPVAEYDRDGPTNIERRDKMTLAKQFSFEAPDHIGCIAAARNRLIGGSWGSRTVYTWTKTGEQIDKRPNPSPYDWQDVKIDRGMLLGAGNRTKDEGAIEWLRLPDLQVLRRILVGITDRGLTYTNEGMTLRDGKLYLLPEDAPTRLFVFRSKP